MSERENSERLLPPRGDYRTLLEADFLKQGGLRERMTRLRIQNRRKGGG